MQAVDAGSIPVFSTSSRRLKTRLKSALAPPRPRRRGICLVRRRWWVQFPRVAQRPFSTLLRASWRRLGSLTVLVYGSVARPSHEALATRPNQNVNLEMNSLKKTGSVTSVEVAGFEPAIPASRTRCSNQVEPHLDGRDGGNRTHEIGLMRAVSHHESSRHPRRESNPESKLRRLASGAAGTGVILKS